jgi:hypothetical protein
VRALDDLRRWRRRTGVDAGRHVAGPFTAKEVHQLAFGLPEQWAGIIDRQRWREHGAAVIEAWQSRVEVERSPHAATAGRCNVDDAEEPKRSEPWPVAFYGPPDIDRR